MPDRNRAERAEERIRELESALSKLIQVVEQLVPEPSARGVADVVLYHARLALARAGVGGA